MTPFTKTARRRQEKRAAFRQPGCSPQAFLVGGLFVLAAQDEGGQDDDPARLSIYLLNEMQITS
jgi:hypothetical protein